MAVIPPYAGSPIVTPPRNEQAIMAALNALAARVAALEGRSKAGATIGGASSGGGGGIVAVLAPALTSGGAVAAAKPNAAKRGARVGTSQTISHARTAAAQSTNNVQAPFDVGSGSGTIVFPVGSTNYIAPSNAVGLLCFISGGGGGGGGGTGTNGGGGGGGGASLIYVISNPSGTYTVFVGPGGSAGAINVDGGNGGFSQITGTNAGGDAQALGGNGGKSNGNAGTGGAFPTSPTNNLTMAWQGNNGGNAIGNAGGGFGKGPGGAGGSGGIGGAGTATAGNPGLDGSIIIVPIYVA